MILLAIPKPQNYKNVKYEYYFLAVTYFHIQKRMVWRMKKEENLAYRRLFSR